MQLCVGVEFLFPLAKPSRSSQNLSETPPGKRVLSLLSKSRKNGHTIENRLTNIKLLLSEMILTTSFSIVKMLVRDVTIFSGGGGGGVYVVFFFIILDTATPS